MVLWKESFSSEYHVEMYSYYSPSNTPPPPIFYQNPNPIHRYGMHRNPPVMEMPMDQQMHFQPIQPADPRMMTYDQQQFLAQPVEQFVGMPDGNMQFYGQPAHPAMNFMVPYYQQPAMDYKDPIGNIENITPPPAAPERRRKKREEKKSVGGKMHQNTECVNCGCRETKMWRRNERGEPECNACNLYERCNGSKRPARLWNKPTIKRRRRTAVELAEQEAGPSAKLSRIKTEIDN